MPYPPVEHSPPAYPSRIRGSPIVLNLRYFDDTLPMQRQKELLERAERKRLVERLTRVSCPERPGGPRLRLVPRRLGRHERPIT